MIAVCQSPGANALTVADAVHARLAALSERFPPDVEYKVLYDTTQAVRASLREVVRTLFTTFVLVVAVTFLFLADRRSTLIGYAGLVGGMIRRAGVSMLVFAVFAVIAGDAVRVTDPHPDPDSNPAAIR